MRKKQVLQALMERSMTELACQAPQALKRIRELMNARSEYVALEAAKDVLDRLGLRAADRIDRHLGGDIHVRIDLS